MYLLGSAIVLNLWNSQPEFYISKSRLVSFSHLYIRIPSVPLPSVLWRCWLGGRKGIRPVKNWVVRCWRGCLSGARCRLAYAQLMPLPLTVWYQPTRVVLEKGPLNVCVCVHPYPLSLHTRNNRLPQELTIAVSYLCMCHSYTYVILFFSG